MVDSMTMYVLIVVGIFIVVAILAFTDYRNSTRNL